MNKLKEYWKQYLAIYLGLWTVILISLLYKSYLWEGMEISLIGAILFTSLVLFYYTFVISTYNYIYSIYILKIQIPYMILYTLSIFSILITNVFPEDLLSDYNFYISVNIINICWIIVFTISGLIYKYILKPKKIIKKYEK